MSSRLKNKITGDVLKTAVGSALNEVLAREPELGPAQGKSKKFHRNALTNMAYSINTVCPC